MPAAESQKMKEVADAARARGDDPAEAMRQEALRQGYTRGVEPTPPVRKYRTPEEEERVREKARTGQFITQEDL